MARSFVRDIADSKCTSKVYQLERIVSLLRAELADINVFKAEELAMVLV